MVCIAKKRVFETGAEVAYLGFRCFYPEPI